MSIKKINITWVIIFLGLGLILLGINLGEAKLFLEKGIKICLDCVGIG
ncbi:MAG: hypothetical protein LWW94_05735 [Candidatus Desulfofervidaceae bacterium]|nr:hypothetical protein [Candidatus Desulfofervidaceae bacterium]